MSTKIVNVCDHASDANESNAIVTRKDLNLLLEDGWEVVSKDATSVAGVDVVEHVLKKETTALTKPQSHTQSVSASAQPAGGSIVIFGGDADQDPANKLVATMDRLEKSLSTGGSHLGGAVRPHIPGAQIVSAAEVGMAQDYGIHAGYVGKPSTDNPWGSDTRPGQLWLRGWHMGLEQRQRDGGPEAAASHVDWDAIKQAAQEGLSVRAVDQPILAAYVEGFHVAQTAGESVEVVCHFRTPVLLEAWKRGFSAGGGSLG